MTDVRSTETPEDSSSDESIPQSNYYKIKVGAAPKHQALTSSTGKKVSNLKETGEFVPESHTESRHFAQDTIMLQNDVSDRFGQYSLVVEEPSTRPKQEQTTMRAESFCSCHGTLCEQNMRDVDTKSLLKVLQHEGGRSSAEKLNGLTSMAPSKVGSEPPNPPNRSWPSHSHDFEMLDLTNNDSLQVVGQPEHNKKNSQDSQEVKAGKGKVTTTQLNERGLTLCETSASSEPKLKRYSMVSQSEFTRQCHSKRAKIVYSCAHCSFRSCGSKKTLVRHLKNHADKSACLPPSTVKHSSDMHCMNAEYTSASNEMSQSTSFHSKKGPTPKSVEEKLDLRFKELPEKLVPSKPENPLLSYSCAKFSDKLDEKPSCSDSCTNSYVKHMPLPAFKQLLRCKYCFIKFEQYSDFKTHMKMHPSEGLLSCALCPYKSTYQNNIDEHVMSHHYCANILLCM